MNQEIERPEKPDAPENWHWAISHRGPSHYTHWLYTNQVLYPDGEFGYECQVYWDKGGDHHVEFIPYTRWNPDGDHEHGYPCHTATFKTEGLALKYAVEKAEELR